MHDNFLCLDVMTLCQERYDFQTMKMAKELSLFIYLRAKEIHKYFVVEMQ